MAAANVEWVGPVFGLERSLMDWVATQSRGGWMTTAQSSGGQVFCALSRVATTFRMSTKPEAGQAPSTSTIQHRETCLEHYFGLVGQFNLLRVFNLKQSVALSGPIRTAQCLPRQSITSGPRYEPLSSSIPLLLLLVLRADLVHGCALPGGDAIMDVRVPHIQCDRLSNAAAA